MRKFLIPLLVPLVFLMSACGGKGHHKLPYKTVAPPPLNGESKPSCSQSGSNHTLGQCLPKLPANKLPKTVRLPSSIRCVDTSNNDPIVGVGNWLAIRHAGYVCAIFKVNEGTGFVDSWAAPQARDAKRAGLTVAGYDFQHVCTADATTEARLFARLEVADGLTGPNTLPGFADTEYPSVTSCNTRSWENAWHATADRALKRTTGTYTGAWWWNPHIGCWWEGSIAWISGYVGRSSAVPRPCGRSQMDLWQYGDRGWNGVSHTDVSVWMDGTVAYLRFTHAPKPHDPYAWLPKTIFTFGNLKTSEYFAVRAWDLHHCKNPAARPICKNLHNQLLLLAGRDSFVAFHELVKGHWVTLRKPRWASFDLGPRHWAISLRLNQR